MSEVSGWAYLYRASILAIFTVGAIFFVVGMGWESCIVPPEWVTSATYSGAFMMCLGVLMFTDLMYQKEEEEKGATP